MNRLHLIPLTHGYKTIVDDVDFEYLQQFKWSASINKRTGRVYAVRKFRGRTVFMHRELLGLTEGDHVQGEHKNTNSLDNRRGNLRTASQSQNNLNRNLGKKNRSGFLGVSWDSSRKKWRAGLKVSLKSQFLGNFDSAEQAARARDAAAWLHFGDFARLNFPVDRTLNSQIT